MKPIMFKFNNDRQGQYRTQTTICKGIENKTVYKKGLTAEANQNIEQMCENQKLLQQIYPKCTFCTATIEGDRVYFEYLEGECYSSQYELAIKKKDKELFCNLLKKQSEIILSCVKDNKCVFNETSQYADIFGDGSAFKNQAALNVADFEFTSHNILLNPKYGLCGVIDYEYVFRFPVPVDLLLYHCVVKTNLWTIDGFSEMMTIQKMLDLLHISTSLESLENAWSMFDKHYGRSAIAEAKLRYLKRKDNIADLKNMTQEMQQEIIGNKNYINILTENLGKQQEYIESLTANMEKQQKYIESLTANMEKQQKYIESQQRDIEQNSKAIYEKDKAIKETIEDCNYKQQVIGKQKTEILHLQAKEKMDVYKINQLEENKISLIKELENSCKEKEKIKVELLAKILELENKVDSIRNSVCWKVTAPLRLVGDKIERIIK